MRRPLFMVCLCLVTIAALRLWIYDSSDRGGEGTILAPPVDGEIVTVTGRVSQKDTQSFTIDAVVVLSETRAAQQSEKLSNAANLRQNIPFEEKLICEYSGEPPVLIGSTVMLQGAFGVFAEATNPGEFDMAEYYHSIGIGGKLVDIRLTAVSSEYSEWREALYQLREYFKSRLYYVFPQKEASILTAMLLGDKAELDADIKELYQQNGIIHILSISGLHITMIGMAVYQLLRRAGAPIWLAAICGGVMLCLYGVMTGLSVSACRAIGMYFVRMVGEVVGRTYDMLTALGILAAVMVWQNPQNLCNAGFLLSFGAILGIGLLYPALLPKESEAGAKKYENEKWKRVLNEKCRKWRKGLIQSILAGTSITLFTLPIQLWFYYEVPVYSILLNLMILPFMSMVLTTGLTVVLVPGTGLIGTITCLILSGYEGLCQCFEQLPFHTWNPGRPEVWQIVMYYLILVAIVILRGRDKRKERHKCRDLWIPVLLTAAVTIIALRIRSETTVTFLDVGQGDCIVMETASGEVFLFDCGSTSRKQVGEYVLLPFLKYQGIRHIDAVFISHSDTDHCSGIEELFAFGEEEGITVGQLVLPDIAETMKEEDFSNVLVSYISAGDSFATESATFLCLNPPEGYESEDSNAYSQCFYVEFYEKVQREQGEEMRSKMQESDDVTFSLLLTGDVEGEGEELLLQELKTYGIDDVTVLKVAHHGSKYSTSKDFLKVAKPTVSIISCGVNNPYGHPHTETLERLSEAGSTILTTPECGAITMKIGKEAKVQGFKAPPAPIQSTFPHSSYRSCGRF